MPAPDVLTTIPVQVPDPEGTLPEALSLWGIDGDLQANEGRMQGCLPFLARTGDAVRVFAAREVGWDLDSGNGLTPFPSEEAAALQGTKLSLPHQVWIRPGQLVVVFGPDFYRDVLALGNVPLSKWIAPLASTPEGFRVICLEVENFEGLARRISDVAKAAFDQEIKKINGLALSARAEAALKVLRNTGYAPLSDQAIRTLAAERIRENPDAYRKSLKLAALRLRQSPEALEQDVHRYFAVLLHRAPVRIYSDERRLAGMTRSPIPAGSILKELLLRQVKESLGLPTRRYRRSLEMRGTFNKPYPKTKTARAGASPPLHRR